MKRTLLAITCLTIFGLGASQAATINIDSPTVTETDSGTTTVTFNITCNPCTEVNAIVGYGTVDGTATTADGDYVGLTGTIDDFGNGTTVETYPVAVTVNGDFDVEGDETFKLRITSASVGCPSLGGGPGGCNGTAAIGTEGTATIQNDDTDALPTAEANGPYAGSEGVAIPVDATGSSDDNGITTYEWDCANDGTFEISSASPTGSSCTYADQGSFTAALRVTDTIGQQNQDTAAVTVANANPTITSATNDGAVEGGSSTITVAATDVPADTLSYAFDCDNAGGFEVGPQAGNTAPCAFADDGSFTVNVQVTDEDGGSATSSTMVTVTNADPTITSVTNDGAIEGGSSTITVAATDVPADTLSYAFDCDNAGGFEVGPQAGNTAPCAFADDGSFTVNVQVTDEDGGSANGSTIVTVTNADPTITSVTNDGAVEGGSSTITVAATDVPADTLSYAFDCDNAGGFEVGPQAGNTAPCAFADDGSFTVNVQVTDEDGGSANGSTIVTVSNADPTITSVTNDGAVEGGNSTITVAATDVPADTLSYAFDCDNAGGFEVGPQAGNTAPCAFADDGSFTVNVQVTDEDGGSATSSTTVTVTNADPVLTVTNVTVTVNEGDTANNDGTFSDTGDDDVTVTAAAVGSIAPATSGNNGTWNWSFDTTDGPDQTQTITITGTDEDTGSGNVTFDLVVNNVAPTGNADAYDTDEDTQLVIAAPGVLINDTDPGTDDLVATAQAAAATAAGGTVTLATDGSFTYDPPTDYFGTDSFDYEVCDSDGACAAAPATATIEVAPVNDVPQFVAGATQTVDEDSGAQAVAGWATGISPGAPALGNENDQSVTFNVTGNTNPALFAAGPAVAPDGELSYTPAANSFGSADVTLTLSDECDSGTPPASCGATGIDTSGPQTFTITVDNVNDPPSFSGGDVITETGTGEQTVAWATGIDVGPANENQTPAFTVTGFTCTPTTLLTAAPSVDPDGTLRYTPEDGQVGDCDISVKLSDGVDETGVVTFNLQLVTASEPIADPQTVETDGGNPLPITLTGSDPDDQLPLTFQVIEPVTDADTGAIISDSGPFRGSLDTTTPLTIGDVTANVTYTPDEPFVSDTVILGATGIFIDDKTQVLSGDVVVNDAGGTLFMDNEATTPAGFDTKADSITLDKKAFIAGDAYCNTVDDSDSDSFQPTVCTPLALPAFDPVADPLPPFRVGDVNTNNVSVPKEGLVNLTPGIYGDIHLDDEATLNFAPGNYSIRSLIGEKKSVLAFGGATEIKVAHRMRTGKEGVVGTAALADEVFFYIAGADSDDDSDKDCDSDSDGPPKAADIGKKSQFFANVYAGNGSIVICEDAVATGAFIGQYVEVQKEVQVSLANGFPEPPDQFDFEVTDQLGLVSERATVLINQDDSCRDDAGQVVAIAARAASASTDGAASIDITLRGCESTGVPVTVTATTPGQGALSGLPAGPAGPPYEFVVTYTPTDSAANNRDSFDFTFDNGVSTATATVEINVPPCDAVEAVAASHSVATDDDNDLTITLSGCDPDDGVLSFSTDPASGDAFIDCASCAITAPSAPITDNRPGFTSVNVVLSSNELTATTTSFDYAVTGLSGSDFTTITVEVNPVPIAPVANDDVFDEIFGGTFSGNVLSNDTDANGDALTATVISGPGNASNFVLNADGSFVYTHNGTGSTDSFDYSASDGGLSDTATVSITLGVVNISVLVDKAPAGAAASVIKSTPAEIDCGGTCVGSFPSGGSIQLYVASEAAGFDFDFWSGDCDSSGNVILSGIAPRSCTANFKTEPGATPSSVDVTVLKDGTGDGTVTSDPAGVSCGLGACFTAQTFTVGTTLEEPRVELLPAAGPGSVFAGFSPGPDCPSAAFDCNCGSNPVLGGALPASCTATFNQAGATLTITFVGSGTVAGTGGLSCDGEPCAKTYSTGTLVSVSGASNTRQPAAWSGDCLTGDFPQQATVLMNGNKSCTVTFP